METVASDNEEIYIVIAQSMVPTIPKYSFVVVRPSDKYQTEDIIAYNRPDGFVCVHRIISMTRKIGETVYTVKGDNDDNPPRETVNKKQVIGRVVKTIPVTHETYKAIREWRLTYRSKTEEGWDNVNQYLQKLRQMESPKE